ncbi:hypothetical protein AZH53_09940 [Methanomicrobiaceae archaeon CYW5]|uniref:GyrI-like domain-containing protein n=1 Tax=Methanovulcanius yangii TaxID=1789227 RepID=UPI0029CA32C4|nr:GyrI-like domain-containing protein [Methanovulcanius yangii]MBT8508725.1 hypothetical protein [Methanovulcanius yangii]
MTDITIKDILPQTVLGLRRRGRYQELIPQMIMEIYVYVEAHGIEGAGMPTFLCHETSPEEVMQAMEAGTADVEVVVPIGVPEPGPAAPASAPVPVPAPTPAPPAGVPVSTEGGETIACYELPGGPMATAVHKGPYETSESTYNELFAWIEAHGRIITGPIREVYLNDPSEVGEEEILTEIYVPVG